jgi:hypothetical protein
MLGRPVDITKLSLIIMVPLELFINGEIIFIKDGMLVLILEMQKN